MTPTAGRMYAEQEHEAQYWQNVCSHHNSVTGDPRIQLSEWSRLQATITKHTSDYWGRMHATIPAECNAFQATIDTGNSCGYWSRTHLQLVKNASDDSRIRLSIVAIYG